MYCGDNFAAAGMTPEVLRQCAKEAREMRYKQIKEEIREKVIQSAYEGYMNAISEAYYIPHSIAQEIIKEYIELGFKVDLSDIYNIDGCPQGKYKFYISWEEDEVSG